MNFSYCFGVMNSAEAGTEDIPGGTSFEAGQGVLDQILVDDLEGLQKLLGMIRHQFGQRFLDQVSPDRVPRVKKGIHKERLPFQHFGDDLQGFKLVSMGVLVTSKGDRRFKSAAVAMTSMPSGMG